MFISHYDKKFLNCTNEQFDKLILLTKILFDILDSHIMEADVLLYMYDSDEIYYSAYYLFKSQKNLNELHSNYCNLARLIYLYVYPNYNRIELNSIVSGMCIDNIPTDFTLLYSEYY